MSPEISERSFEEAIEWALLQHGPDSTAGTSAKGGRPGGRRDRRPRDAAPVRWETRRAAIANAILRTTTARCACSRRLVDFVLANAAQGWQKPRQHHGAAVKEQFLKRLSAESSGGGARRPAPGDQGSRAAKSSRVFRPASGLNEETRRLHAANVFSAVRQVHYSTKNESSSTWCSS